MSSLTPSFKGALIAGIGVWTLFWSALQKADKIPLLGRFVKKEKAFDWVNHNKSLTLLGTEALNFGLHGISNPDSVAVALGGTATNVIMIFGIIPWRQRKREKLNTEKLKIQGIA